MPHDCPDDRDTEIRATARRINIAAILFLIVVALNAVSIFIMTKGD